MVAGRSWEHCIGQDHFVFLQSPFFKETKPQTLGLLNLDAYLKKEKKEGY